MFIIVFDDKQYFLYYCFELFKFKNLRIKFYGHKYKNLI